ncbi:MAG: SHOCT-like domain-containing protein [Halanaerobiales bacterium]
MSDERLRILKMVEEGKIDVGEANKLLETLDSSNNKNSNKKTKGRFVKIFVEENGEEKVDISIPLVLARSFMKFIPNKAKKSLNDKDIDIDNVIEKLENDMEDGTLVNIKDGEDKVIIKIE